MEFRAPFLSGGPGACPICPVRNQFLGPILYNIHQNLVNIALEHMNLVFQDCADSKR